MSIFRKVLVAFLSICVLCVGIITANLYAEEKEGILEDLAIEISADIAINSKYIWRGFTLDNDPVMQSGIYVSTYGISASIWGNFDIGADDTLNSDEVDYVIDYTYEFDRFNLSVGYIYYTFPPVGSSSREFYVGVGFDVPVSPCLTYYHDYVDAGDYIELSLAHSFALGKGPVTLDISGHFGYNNKLFINGAGEDIALTVGATIPLSSGCSVLPSISYSVPLGDLKNTDDGGQSSKFYAGVILAY